MDNYKNCFPHIFIIVLLILLSSESSQSFANLNTDSLTSENESYFISLKNKFSFYAYGISKLNEIELRDKEKDSPVKYKPNEKFNVGFGFKYRWLGLAVAFNLGFLNNDNELYGNTKSIDVQSDIYTQYLLMTANLQSYQGYYWNNINDYDSTWSIKDSVPLRPDITTYNLGFNGFYALNRDEFSFNAAYNGTQWQKKSAGSWIAGAQFSIYGLTSESGLVPDELLHNYPVFDSLSTLNTASMGVNFGYSYTKVWKEFFYINGTLILGLSAQGVSAYNFQEEELYSDLRLAGKSHFRFALGYNNDKSYGGISFILDSSPLRNEFDSELVYTYGKFRIFVGRRIDVKRK